MKMLKHTVTHRSSSSLSTCLSSQPTSLPYQLPSYQNESSFQTRRGSLSSSYKSQCYPRNTPEQQTNLTPLPSNKYHGDRQWPTSADTNSRKGSVSSSGERKDLLKRKISGSRSFVELINLLDAHPSLVDMELDDSCSEVSFSSVDTSISSIGSKAYYDHSCGYSANSYAGATASPMKFTTLPRNNEYHRNASLTGSESFSSIESCTSCSSLNSSGTLIHSKSPSSTTLSETIPVKVYIRRLKPDMEYKTLPLTSATTCREMILSLLVKFRLRHRDPNLFFVMMEVTVRSAMDSAPARRILVLDDNARPAELQQCRPTGEARFSIGVRRGGLIRVHDSILMPGSQYKSLIICYGTTSDELVQLLLKCYNNSENPKHFALHEVCKNPYNDRPLTGSDCPLMVQADWPKLDRSNRAFVLRRNIVYSFSLKPKLKWYKNVEESGKETEIAPRNGAFCSLPTTPMSSSAETRNSCFSSSGSVSSNCSTSSDSSLDSGYLGSPLSSFKLPASSVASIVSKPSQSYVKPHMPLYTSHTAHSLSIPLTHTLSRLTHSMDTKTILNEPLKKPTELPPHRKQQPAISKTFGTTKYAPPSKPDPKMHIVAIRPINLKQLPEFSHTIGSLATNVKHAQPHNIYKATVINPTHNIKPRVVGEIPKDPVLWKLRRHLSESLHSSNQSYSQDNQLKSTKLCPPPPPPSPRINRSNFFINTKQNASFPNAERKFYEAVESLKSLGSADHCKTNILKIVE